MDEILRQDIMDERDRVSKKSTFFDLLIICITLIICDFVSTYYALQYLNAIEINPLYTLCGSILFFFIVKAIATMTYIIIIISYYDDYPKSAMISLIIITGLYAGVVTSNAIQLIKYYTLC